MQAETIQLIEGIESLSTVPKKDIILYLQMYTADIPQTDENFTCL